MSLRRGATAYSYRTDPAVPTFQDDRPIIVFDGDCVMCSAFAQFILRADRRGRYRLLAAQSPIGVALYRHYGLAADDYTTNLLLEAGRPWLKSDAALRILRGLGLPYALLAAGYLLPKPFRDGVYGIVARNRLRWFGRREQCFMPDPSQSDRFL